MIPMTVSCALAVAALMLGEYLDNDRIRYTSKPIASLAFIAVGALALSGNSTISEFELAVIAGLILGAIGDMALLSEQGFLAGLVAFLLGHLHYVLAFATVAPLATWATPIALVPIAIAIGALRWLWPHVGSLRIPVIAYVAVITAMVIGGLAVWRGAAIAHPTRMLAGTLLFFASDFAVAREKFVVSSIGNRIIGLPLYYAGQLLIAWSIS